nr:hypothetical protein [Tanacetum cinerariifolium]
MKQYMSKTRADYGSEIARPKIDDKDRFELKGQFLKELRDNTFSGSDHEDANEHIEKQEPDETLYQAWEQFKELLMKCTQHYLMEMHEVILFYNGLDVQTSIFLIQKVTRSTETSDGLAAIQAQLNNLGREIKKLNEKVYAAQVDAIVQNQGASIKTLEIQIGQISKVIQERGFGSLPSSTEANSRDHVKLILTTVEADSNPIRCIGSPQYAVSTPHNKRFMFGSRQTQILLPSHLNDYYYKERKGSFGPQFSEAYSYKALHMDTSIPRKEKDPWSFTLPCYINNVCFDNSLADLGASVSVMPLSTYLNLGLGELAHTKLTVELADRTVKYPKGIAENVLDKVELKRKNVVGAFMNVPIFVRKIYVVTRFVVVENIDGYRDQDMGDIILVEPLCTTSCVEAKRFKHLSIAQCKKIKQLLKVNLHDKLNGVSYSYQKLKSFNKEVLNLGPGYIRDAKMEEWLTSGHISVHEME